MPFGARNPFYLRISETSVLPLYVYLDERHVDWMSDHVLQHVLADLRPLIIPKLQAEADVHLGPGGPANAKKGTVEVHKGDSYQFCFFFRKTEPHSVLVKSRHFYAAPPPQARNVQKRPTRTSETPIGKRKGRTLSTVKGDGGRKKRKTKGKGKSRMATEDDEVLVISSEDSDHSVVETEITGIVHRRSGRPKKLVAGGYWDQSDSENQDTADDDNVDSGETKRSDDTGLDQSGDASVSLVKDEPMEADLPESIAETDVDDDDDPPYSRPGAEAETTELELEESESKPKPALKLGYSSFLIYGRCLCVVVEPWPPLPSTTKGPAIVDLQSNSLRAPSIAPPEFVSSASAARREKTPLFLPERNKDETPMDSAFTTIRDTHQDDDIGGMMLFSQVLNSAGDLQAGVADEDDGMDGAVFLGDADEAREF